MCIYIWSFTGDLKKKSLTLRLGLTLIAVQPSDKANENSQDYLNKRQNLARTVYGLNFQEKQHD